MSLANYRPPDQNIEYLCELIELIQTNGQKAVLVTTPFYYSYNQQFDSIWIRKNYFDILEKLSVKYEIPYLDFSNRSDISCNNAYFKNSDHLNEMGEKVFSELIFKEILNQN